MPLIYVTLRNATIGQKKRFQSICSGNIQKTPRIHGFGPLLADTRINAEFGVGPVSSADVLAEQVVRCELSLRASCSSETATPSFLPKTVAVRKDRRQKNPAGQHEACCPRS